MSFNIQAAFDAYDAERESLIADLEHQAELLLAAADKAKADLLAAQQTITAKNSEIASKNAAIADLEAEIDRLEARIKELESGTPAPQPEPEPEPEQPAPNVQWPKSHNTGPRAGVVLSAYTGPNVITKAGAKISGKIINGPIEIKADDVVIEDCRQTTKTNYGIYQTSGKRAIVRYNEIDGSGSSAVVAIALQADALIEGNNIHGMVLAIQQWGTNMTVRGNYIHDLAETSSNPDKRHFDGIQNLGASGFLYENNAIEMPPSEGGTASIFVSGQNGTINGGKIINNLCTGEPAYQVYIEKSRRGVSNVEITNNYIENGIYGPIANDAGAKESGNVTWNDKQPATVPAPVKAWRAA